MKEKKRHSIPLNYKHQVKSLCWVENHLVDFASGALKISLDGQIDHGKFSFGYEFDGAICSSDGEFAVVYERHGTKGVVLHKGQIIREINRSHYCADAYEYPIALLSRQDKTYLIHCPDEYNAIEMEEFTTGKRLTEKERAKIDFFQARFQISPNQRLLLSAGWVWHPLDAFLLYDLSTNLSESPVFESHEIPSDDFGLWEINEAAFIDNTTLLLSGTVDQDESGSAIVKFDLGSRKTISCFPIQEPTGNLMVLNNQYAIGFYQYPKLIDINTGQILLSWTEIPTDKQSGSINPGDMFGFSPKALDPGNKRFAVATENTIEVIELD